MSWAAHDVEPYSLQAHFGKKVAIIPLLIGSYSPDVLSKWFVYGITIGGYKIKAEDPIEFHRGWPGVGFTHSLAFGVVVALIIFLVSRNRVWSFSFFLGQWAHAISDIGDTQGVMLFFPFSMEHISAGAWKYAGYTGRYIDAGAYYSGLGWVWDGVWIAYGAINWRVLTKTYFYDVVYPADGTWAWLGRRLPEVALLTLYRAMFFYGTARWTAWLIWAHLMNSFDFDLSWGGPHWVPSAEEFMGALFTCPCASCMSGGGVCPAPT